MENKRTLDEIIELTRNLKALAMASLHNEKINYKPIDKN